MTDANSVLFTINAAGIAELTLNRPAVHNAFDDSVIEQLITHLESAQNDTQVRALVLRSNGKNFSAGADLGWMKRMATNSHQENLDDAARLATLMQRLNDLDKPTIALIQGAAYGGAVGLAACCDIVIASEDARFCLSEVKIGLIPAVISPYVVRAIGERQSRRYFITAEPFTAQTAQQFGLVHETVSTPEFFDDTCNRLINTLLRNSPQGMKAAKALVFSVSNKVIDPTIIQHTTHQIADIRVSAEGQEGLSAFLEKRTPNWVQE